MFLLSIIPEMSRNSYHGTLIKLRKPSYGENIADWLFSRKIFISISIPERIQIFIEFLYFY